MQQHIQFGSRRIDFTLTYLDRKSLGIKVHPDTSVEVLSPADAKEEDVIRKVRSRAPWILKQIDYFSSYRPASPPRRFVNGETHLYLGRQYRLKAVKNENNEVKAYRGQLFIHTQDIAPSALQHQLQVWYKQRAQLVFHEMLQEILPRFRKYKIDEPTLFIRSMSKRWGSCTPSRKIILNVQLIKAPKGSIEYVIIHELCHLVHHNHTKSFFSLLNKMMPDWKKWKERLEYSLY